MMYPRTFRSLLPLLLPALVAGAAIPASAQTKGQVEKAKTAEERAVAALREADAERATASSWHVN